MNAASRLGRLGVVLAAVITGLVLSGAPASANTGGFTRYENVGNPTWCMSSDLTSAYLVRCTGSPNELFEWEYVDGSLVRLYFTRDHEYCLTALPGGRAFMSQCDPVSYRNQTWDVWGQNGWVVLQKPSTTTCLIPQDTHLVALYYRLALVPCPVSRTNVPNIFAWRYFV